MPSCVDSCVCIHVHVCIIMVLVEIFARRNCFLLLVIISVQLFCSVKFLSHLDFIRYWANITNSAWVFKTIYRSVGAYAYSVYQGLSPPPQRPEYEAMSLTHCMTILGSFACARGVR